MRVESWELVILEEFYAFVVDFDGFEFALFLGEELGENAHSWTDFEDGNVGTSIDGVGDAAGDVEVAKEVLTEVFLGFHQFHGCKITIKREKNQIMHSEMKRKMSFSFAFHSFFRNFVT